MAYTLSKTGADIDAILSKVRVDDSQLIITSGVFPNTPGIRNTTSIRPLLAMQFTDAPSTNTTYGYLALNYTNYSGRFQFQQYSGTSSGRTSYSEIYRLPATESGLSASASYEILTTKSPVTIAQGGTGATSYKTARDAFGLKFAAFEANTAVAITLPTGYKGFLFLASAYQTCSGIYRVHVNNSGVAQAPIAMSGEASGATFTTSSNVLTVTMEQYTYGLLLDVNGTSTIS